MPRFLICLFAAWLLPALSGAQRPNVLFIGVDDLRNDLGALGASHAKTPHLDAFAKTARVFTRHYTQSPTCGASRFALLSGRYPRIPAQVGNNAIRDTHSQWAAQSMPAMFRDHGYRTMALGKITHYPGGLTGEGWAVAPEELPGAWERSWIPNTPWKTPLALMHGYANGEPRRPGKSPPWEAHDGPDEAYPDAWLAAEALATLKQLREEKKPWFFGVGFFKPHLPFAAPKKWHDLHAAGVPDLHAAAAAKPAWPSGWHGSGEFRGNYAPDENPDTNQEYARSLRRAYAASVSYVDAQIGRVLGALHETGLETNTIVILWGDHGFLLGEHAIWGKHCLYEEALRAPLMIRFPGLAQPGKTATALAESVDLLPTLADLCGFPRPTAVDGRSLRPQLENPAVPSSKPAHAFWTRGQRSVRTDRWRLIVHPSSESNWPQFELFDYVNDPLETRNHAADHPEVIRELLAKLEPIPQPTAPTQ